MLFDFTLPDQLVLRALSPSEATSSLNDSFCLLDVLLFLLLPLMPANTVFCLPVPASDCLLFVGFSKRCNRDWLYTS